MTLLTFIFLLTILPAQSANSRYLPKSAISNPVFGPRQVYGLLKGSVTVKCFYPPTNVNRHDRKYWCKESGRGCMTIVSTNGYTDPGYKGRASITDHPQAESFEITISGLKKEDAGNYQCGVGVNGRGLSHRVKLEVTEGPHVPEGDMLFYVALHGTLTTTCSFGAEAASMRKFFCKVWKNGCWDIIDSYGKIDEDYKGRTLLSSGETPGSFTITITQMSWEDSGLFLCGVGFYNQDAQTKELDVHVYKPTNVPQGKPTIFAVKGSSATFECRYNPVKSSSVKYLCKWREKGCARIIDNSGFVSDLYEGRVTMFDNPANNTVAFIMNQLQDSDKGYYWCMSNEEKELQSSTELKITDGEPGLKGKKEVEAQVGSRVDLTCFYPCKYYSYEKYWCKWNNTGCQMMTASDQKQPGLDVTCDTANKTVILSFESVSKEDEGWYWCGVKRNGLFGETMAVHLIVTEGELSEKGFPACQGCKSSPGRAEPGFVPQGRVFSNAVVPDSAASESSGESHGPHTLTISLSIVGGVLLVLATAFVVFKYRQLKRSDLVSVGSYRTNISMSDFEAVKEYGTSNKGCTKDSDETQIGGEEFITTVATPESAAEAKKAKRSSKEDADLAHSTFLLTSSSIVQGGTEGDGAAPDMSPQTWEGKI
ncbi:PIGR protein, partial [Alcedo cyanopectus]|nr:PIGR protein [Ceyx cyanopectus]